MGAGRLVVGSDSPPKAVAGEVAAVPRVTVEEQSQPDLPFHYALFAVERVTGQPLSVRSSGGRPRARLSLHLGMGAAPLRLVGTGSDARSGLGLGEGTGLGVCLLQKPS